ncbi:hypothetical protein Lfu02_08870 [Longispora fulva]|uniref:Uncharacterized protein n=1 Tax=Longispora fulva TaxID=619741 RepID=A0A8J7GFX0_9ACTN|nr:hypothetical protein [Longispora fulva]MBG6135248.1 hypothetical protein [Longispora fulva]GIG56515.1 hypothetical protein Lfu02_08870 [Longispora fulva]
MRTPLRLLILAAVLLVAGWLLVPWEWSLIDDGQALGHVQSIGVRQTAELYRFTDGSWGLFRPMFWLYMGTFYLLPVKIAFTARMLMLATAVAIPAWLVWRRTGSRPLAAGAAVLLAGNPSLLRNLAYPSLQEGPGVALVALGLLPYRRPWPRILFWLAAAWFKSPFSWLLVCYGVLLLVRPGERRLSDRLHGLVALAAGAGTLVTAYTYSQAGDYTAALDFGSAKLFASALDAARQIGPPLLVVALGAFAFGLRYAGRDGVAWAVAGGGALYLANLLPWKTDEHYAGPYVYLLMVGVVLSVTPTRSPFGATGATVGTAGPRVSAAGAARRFAVVAAALTGLLLAGVGGRYVYRNVANTAELEACVLRLPGTPLVGYNRQEGAPRLTELAVLRRPGWAGQVVWIPNGAPAGVDYYIHQDQYGPGTPALMTGPVVCETPLATVYRSR